LKFPNHDKTANAWSAGPARMALLENTASPDQIDNADYDTIYFTGGHAVTHDFPDSEGLQRITREIHERGRIVSAVCHGYCSLLNSTHSDGTHLIAGKKITGFAWQEEILARVDKLVPYNAEKGRQETRRSLRESQTTLRLLYRRRRQPRHWPESRIREKDGQEDRRVPPTTNHVKVTSSRIESWGTTANEKTPSPTPTAT